MYDCEWCDEPIEGETAALWFDAPLGMTCCHTHRSQDCAKPLVAQKVSEGWKFRDGPPLSKAERESQKVGRSKGTPEEL